MCATHQYVLLQTNVPSIFLQLRGPAIAMGRKILHDLKTARHFKSFFVVCIIRIFTMKIETYQLRATIQCAREHFNYCAAAHPRRLERTLLQTQRGVQIFHGQSVYTRNLFCFCSKVQWQLGVEGGVQITYTVTGKSTITALTYEDVFTMGHDSSIYERVITHQ
jgi:hypothetical protein